MVGIFKFVLCILIRIIMIYWVSWSAFALHWLLQLVASHTDLAILTLSQILSFVLKGASLLLIA
jgi:hypothetical protein